eukprot:gnl/TRDRNA2_/TRDRNA2_151539_c2_seq1.p1 gnl/TRDRNA2_/TRDRNA2_151539_c2~~gnl/TRDRNA2_/TRDRNA2_151539_c2_seq1.p1  ORF type:complete len:388 (-),score=66.12 gnl/TRDRNA2_/TRDRNA2_151539_c2_seq1:81-1220(-)
MPTSGGDVIRPDPVWWHKCCSSCSNHLVALLEKTGWPVTQRILKTTPISCTRLLNDLLVRFKAASFQSRWQELHSKQQSVGDEANTAAVEMTFAVQCEVLPKYGFEGSPAGVKEMRSEVAVHADGGLDAVARKLRLDIHLLLDMFHLLPQVPKLEGRFHTVGDSHSTYGWHRSVVVHHLGPLLCYNVHRMNLEAMCGDAVDPSERIEAGDAVCFCFGEIDCRAHVFRHCGDSKRYQDVIDEIISSYFGYLQSQMPKMPQGVRFFIYNVVPPVRREGQHENTAFPFWGSDEERLSYVVYFNARLKVLCGHLGYTFFDIYDSYADADGFLLKEYSDGSVHIKDGRFIVERMHLLRVLPKNGDVPEMRHPASLHQLERLFNP